MESTPSKKTIEGFWKVPQFENILEEELNNAKQEMDLPFRYTFLANHNAEAADEHEKKKARPSWRNHERVQTAL